MIFYENFGLKKSHKLKYLFNFIIVYLNINVVIHIFKLK